MFEIGKFGSLFRLFNKFRHDSELWLRLFTDQGNINPQQAFQQI